MYDKKRSFKNIIINPTMQKRLSFYFIAINIALFGLMMLVLNMYFSELKIMISNIPELPISTQLQMDDFMNKILLISVSFLWFSIVMVFIYSVIVSHRIAGPMYAILKYIDEMRSGKFEEPRPLRPYDELKPIMDSLGELSIKLKNKI
jgi:signal transduction histidine kinase